MWLAFVPLGVVLAFGSLLLPRRADPTAVPLPIADARELARAAATDATLAENARREPLPPAVRALGSALRDFHTLEARGGDEREFALSRQAIDTALIDALPAGQRPLLSLRALQCEGFLAEIRRFEATGEESDELRALSGGFLRSMRAQGWAADRRLSPGTAALRTMYKEMWNKVAELNGQAVFEPSLDEQRALYAFYLANPHPSQAMRDSIAAARRGARNVDSCKALEEAQRIGNEKWRLERITKLSAIDPLYPAAYARGVVSYRAGDAAAAEAAFRTWLRDHPEGPLALRAQNYLRSAMVATRVE
jgi:hypothetical protein